MFKYAVLDKFIASNAHLPEQGTDEWKRLRHGFIGGSEIATLLKKNKYKSPTKLVLEKLGFNPFVGNVITHWGNVFEEFIRQHCEEIFLCSIKETGSIPYDKGSLSYSPDGLAVVPTGSLRKQFGVLEGIDMKCPTQLVLFEFKCPHTRIPDNNIPEHYLPQVSIGMNIIDIMETAVFVQAVFRRCSFDQLRYDTTHNPYGHFKRADTSAAPIECGFMIFYSDEQDDYADGLIEAMTENGDIIEDTDIVDIGSINDPGLLEEILGGYVKKTFKIDYTTRMLYTPSVFERDSYTIDMYNKSMQFRLRKKLYQRINDLPNIIGVLPFKLLSVYMTPVQKNATYIEDTDAHTKAIKALQCIEDHRGMDDRAVVMKSVRKYKL